TESVDESQIILAEYQWNDKKIEISLADFREAIEQLSIFQQENYASKAGKTEYLPEFIDEKLKVLAAIDKGLDKDEGILKKSQEYKHTLLIERLTLIEVDEKVFLTEEDRRRYYEEHKSEYIEEAAARVTCISVLEKTLAQEALAQIKAGVAISELAKGLSEKEKLFGPGSNKLDPGNTGLFTKDESEDWQPFVDAAFDMEVGEITEEILELEMDHETYYLIFRKEEHIPTILNPPLSVRKNGNESLNGWQKSPRQAD
ncbi:peptidyl-prolyl cis-trans isomerase, partial [Candidatus Poribacteria bacterium]|nr:peptidyl-prolyl cis-trans isomerase [Candidatus Poribacteria bacterium]